MNVRNVMPVINIICSSNFDWCYNCNCLCVTSHVCVCVCGLSLLIVRSSFRSDLCCVLCSVACTHIAACAPLCACCFLPPVCARALSLALRLVSAFLCGSRLTITMAFLGTTSSSSANTVSWKEVRVRRVGISIDGLVGSS
jgi:hypothetical protein